MKRAHLLPLYALTLLSLAVFLGGGFFFSLTKKNFSVLTCVWLLLILMPPLFAYLVWLRPISRLLHFLSDEHSKENLAKTSLSEVYWKTQKRFVVNQKKLKKERRATERFFSMLMNMHEGVVLVDTRHKILFCNSSGRRLLKCEGQDLEGKAIEEVVTHGAILSVFRKKFHPLIEEEVRYFDRGEEKTLWLQLQTLGEGKRQQRILLFHDISKSKKHQKMREDFVANASHELKTPLTVIQGYLDIVCNEDVEQGQQMQFLGKIQKNVEQLQVLTQDLLRLAHIESGHEDVEVSKLNTSKEIEEIVQSLRKNAEQKQQNLTLLLQPGTIQGSKERFRAIIQNILSNAIKYTQEEGKIEIRSWSEREVFCVAVEDNGPGISAKEQSRIFERFYRVDPSRNHEVVGTGLGLSIVKALVESFGGEIKVSDAIHQGTIFTVTFPI